MAFSPSTPKPVKPPALEAPLVSLVTAARLRDETDERWGNGVSFAPFACTPNRTGAYAACDSSYTKTIPTLTGDVEFLPIGIWGGDQCSTFGWEVRDYVMRAKGALLAAESYWLEQELFGATITGTNPHLANTNATVVSGGPYGAADGLMLLEQELANNTTGNRAMIHIRPVILGALIEARVVRRVGNLWLTYMDNVVVPGRGYAGTGPSGQAVTTNDWMYASGIVEVIRGPIHHFPEHPEQEIDLRHNTVTVFADRLGVAIFDPCINYAVNVTTPGAATQIAVQ